MSCRESLFMAMDLPSLGFMNRRNGFLGDGEMRGFCWRRCNYRLASMPVEESHRSLLSALSRRF